MAVAINAKKAEALLAMNQEERTSTPQFKNFVNENPVGTFANALLTEDSSALIEKHDRKFVASLKKIVKSAQ